MSAPTSSAQFDRAYPAPLTPWGDTRIPTEVKSLVGDGAPRSALELGCGVGRFARFVAQQGLQVTAVDFSAVAIGKAKARVAGDAAQPVFQVGDVTNLAGLTGPFDVAYDVGCFHCLASPAQQQYAAEVSRVLRPGGTHLIWALDDSPADEHLGPDLIQSIFKGRLQLMDAKKSRRRLAASHWYWLRNGSV